MHRRIAMRNPRQKPFWLRAEGDEWQGLWEKGVFKKWNRSDLLPNDRVFTSNMGINTESIPEPMGTCVEKVWFRSQNPWEINSFLAFALSRVVGKG